LTISLPESFNKDQSLNSEIPEDKGSNIFKHLKHLKQLRQVNLVRTFDFFAVVPCPLVALAKKAPGYSSCTADAKGGRVSGGRGQLIKVLLD